MKIHIDVPSDVPTIFDAMYVSNMQTITKNSNRCAVLIYDHKIEHMYQDFVAAPWAADPDFIHQVSSNCACTVLATYAGVIARHAKKYPSLAYIVKCTAALATNASRASHRSVALSTIEQVMKLRDMGIHIIGIGMTLYLGGQDQEGMLCRAAEFIYQAHQHGLIALMWAYATGMPKHQQHDPYTLAGLAGIAHSIGADIVKLKQPYIPCHLSVAQTCAPIIQAASNTKVSIAGEDLQSADLYLKDLEEYLQAGFSGCAVGRNVFQRKKEDAIAMCNAIAAVVYQNMSAADAFTRWFSPQEKKL